LGKAGGVGTDRLDRARREDVLAAPNAATYHQARHFASAVVEQEIADRSELPAAFGGDNLGLRALRRERSSRSRCRRWYNQPVDRVVQVFTSFADAERADEDYYASLTPDERVDVLLELIESYRNSLGPAADRFERVHRVAELSQS
jgi:hypothetical protein